MTAVLKPRPKPAYERYENIDEIPEEDLPTVVLPPALQRLSHDEATLAAILMDRSGIDLVEMIFVDEQQPTRCYRVMPFQWPWWRCMDALQVDQGARSLGKSESIIAQATAFPYNFPGQEFMIVTPEGSHADALTERFEMRLFGSRLMQEMLAGGRRSGVTHHPFQALFQNGARIFVRLPQRSGVGVKGCVTADALVLTREHGLIPVSKVGVGDHTWTHRNHWLPTTAVEDFDADVLEVRGPGSFPVKVTGHHQFFGARNLAGRKQAVRLSAAHWARADELQLADGAINFHWSGPGDGAWDEAEDVVPVPVDRGERPEFWWLVGRWIADGYSSSQVLRSGGRGRRRVHWVATPRQHPEITRRLDDLGMHYRVVERSHSSADVIEHCSGELAVWLEENCGRGAENKRLPNAAFTLARHLRRELLEGYLSGDGSACRPDRVTAGSASRELAVGIGILAQGLGSCVGYSKVDPKVTEVMGTPLKSRARTSYRVNVTVGGRGKGVHRDGYAFYKVRSVEQAGVERVYNIINDDHSYLANGIFHHNTHPVILHIDEAQDVSERTWNELPEIVRKEVDGHQMRAHGVSKGVQDDSFAKKTLPNSGWTVHRITKLHRPDLRPYTFVRPDGTLDAFTTNETEVAQRYARENGYVLQENWREMQAREYGGRESPDFKRNVYGVHGDAMNRIFVLTRLMAGVDTNESSDYNLEEYHRFEIKSDQVAIRAESRSGRAHDIEVYDDEQANALVEMVDLPRDHLENYKVFWCGMDVGVIGDPSEIVVLGEYVPKGAQRTRDANAKLKLPNTGVSQFKLLTRIHLHNMAPDLQAHLIMHVINHYGPRAFSLDRTGNGIGILRALQRLAGTARTYVLPEAENPESADLASRVKARDALTAIKGYNFSEKVIIEIDERIVEERGLTDPKKILTEAGVRQNVKDAATDVLRELVDAGRLRLPYDSDVINQMNGQTWQMAQEPVDQYGRSRRNYSRGDFHILDAMRMFALGMDKQPIEELVAATRAAPAPVLDRIG